MVYWLRMKKLLANKQKIFNSKKRYEIMLSLKNTCQMRWLLSPSHKNIDLNVEDINVDNRTDKKSQLMFLKFFSKSHRFGSSLNLSLTFYNHPAYGCGNSSLGIHVMQIQRFSIFTITK